ncbi:MAG TPA: glycosyltransferase family 4 protein [Thermoleophilaceae bacterium]
MTNSGSALRIALVAPVGGPVRHGVGESVEQLVALLADELVRRGHSVTLFATGDSETSAELRFLFDHGYEFDQELWDWQFTESLHVAHAYSQAAEFDVIHNHSYHFALPLTPFVEIPNVQTHHVEMSPAIVREYKRAADVHLVAVSRFQARHFDGRPNLHLIHHGIETGAFPFGTGDGGYLLFLGRMIRDKGPAEAIEVARQAGLPLVLAGPAEEGFDERVAPLVDGRDVTYVGRVDAVERNRLLAGATALVYPLLYGEPFGLVLVEALACGTPVVGTRTGAVPEIVEDGVTGFLAESWAEMAELVPRAAALDRRVVRERAVERFDFRRMVDDHERLYAAVVANGSWGSAR